MPSVIVDGLEYAPIGQAGSRIGIGVTTRNRPEALEQTLKHIGKYLPPAAKLVVVDDASDKPVPEANYRFEKNAGIARAKNKCLELLDDCEHIFLIDDDTYPVVDEWWKPYVDSPEPHLMWSYQRPKSATGDQLSVVWEDSETVAYHATRGCMLYVENRVVRDVGGLDPVFGQWGWEHVSWSDRIHNRGWTTFPYQDAKAAKDYFESLDQQEKIKSTATDSARKFAETTGQQLREERRYSTEFIEYREGSDVVLTALLTGQSDPQRGKRMSSDVKMLQTLLDSLKANDAHAVVLHDEMKDPKHPAASFEKVEAHAQPYFERWVQYWRYLRDHPEVSRVWCVDGTDVEMLRSPFDDMQPGTLYVGYEPKVVGIPWMEQNHPSNRYGRLWADYKHHQLLNAGLVGGDRETVMEFLHWIIRGYHEIQSDTHFTGTKSALGVGDMAMFNLAAYEHFADRLSWGSHVCTVFKQEERNSFSWWRHK